MPRQPDDVRSPSVAKVFLGWRTKILRAADAFYARRRKGLYRFIQNRSPSSVAALKSEAAAEKSKDPTFARFLGLFDFRLLQQLSNGFLDRAKYAIRDFRLSLIDGGDFS
jgi:hypothetical protein